MQDRIDPDATPGVKLLRLFRLLLVDGRKHFQSELSEKLQCSAQTIIRMTNEIETVIGANLETGIENRRRWYRMVSNKPNKLGLEFGRSAETLLHLPCQSLSGNVWTTRFSTCLC